jgi:hypothetical protein
MMEHHPQAIMRFVPPINRQLHATHLNSTYRWRETTSPYLVHVFSTKSHFIRHRCCITHSYAHPRMARATSNTHPLHV